MEAPANSEVIRITASTGEHGEGRIVVHQFTSRQRWARAMGWGVMGVMTSAILALIPIVHFVLVPLGLLVTALVVSLALRSRARIQRGDATCPACGAPFRILPRPYRLPFRDQCEQCRRPVVVEALAENGTV